MRFIYLLPLLLISSCTAYQVSTVSGKYATKGGIEWGSSIVLNEDSTFHYNWQTGLLFGESSGSWELDKRRITLNSAKQPINDTTPQFYIINQENRNSKYIVLDLFFPDSIEPLIGAQGIMYNEGDTIDGGLSDVEGRLFFEKKSYDSISVYFVGLKEIIIKENENDYFEIATVDFLEDMYEYFLDEIWLIRGRTLIDRSRNVNYYEKKFYRKE